MLLYLSNKKANIKNIVKYTLKLNNFNYDEIPVCRCDKFRQIK